MTRVQRHIPLALFFLAFLLVAPYTHAQSDNFFVSPDPDATVSLTMTPKNPSPGDTVHLSVTGGSRVDLQNSTITWYQNGKNISKGIGITSIDIKAGVLGTKLDMGVQVDSPDGGSAASSLSIIPTHIDLLVDSDSYTPPFYRGRALPSAGTQMRMQALVYFKRTDGSFVPPNSIVYTWSENGQIIGKVSGKGRQNVTLPSPVLYGTSVITVNAVSNDGLFSGSASIRISSIEPILALYENHPLFGFMYHQAMGEKTSIPDSETTFAAVPYFADIKNPNDPRLRYNWTVNGSVVPTDTTRPSEITINADKSDGKATISLSLSHSSNVFMNPKGDWDVVFRTFEQTSPFSSSF
ncbi:hypothetical protein HYT05_04390 [Candidatus Kaiserbacteria bacterium]|nr:hypothetical protein [Candidatus Kaiserbacteria bacterium]